MREDLPPCVRRAFGLALAEGAAWKLAPARLDSSSRELSLDNDCILWSIPGELARWLDDPAPPCLFATDTTRAYGRFDALCPPAPPLNAGLRALPEGLDLERSLQLVLMRSGSKADLTSELDEQGLQVAAASLESPPRAVPARDLTMCSPFHPHTPDLGACGAHFIGLNARHIPWDYYGRPGDQWMAEHWARLEPLVRARTDGKCQQFPPPKTRKNASMS